MTEHDITTSDAARAMGRKGGKAKNKKKAASSTRNLELARAVRKLKAEHRKKKKIEAEKCE